MAIWVGFQNLVLDILNGYVADLVFADEFHQRVATLSWAVPSPEWKTDVSYLATTYQISAIAVSTVGAQT
ncbi:hypothetical protein VIGAN_04009600 [Vigna angularis var. angularis]|uniref:Uncharacterized protein n=1 Tax=Vigna angularis var. angularis TaxID=157739 RepID=A0A0S3RQY1_PHAAN|nr:hypothetical protein VIGAN_04009600 [Vigna angularis var. angularis]